MVGYDGIVAEALQRVREIMPWDLSRMLAAGDRPILLDVREPSEFASLHIPNSINVPRGILNNPANGIMTKPYRSWPPDASKKSSSSAAPANARCWLLTPCNAWATST